MQIPNKFLKKMNTLSSKGLLEKLDHALIYFILDQVGFNGTLFMKQTEISSSINFTRNSISKSLIKLADLGVIQIFEHEFKRGDNAPRNSYRFCKFKD